MNTGNKKQNQANRHKKERNLQKTAKKDQKRIL